MAQNKKEELVSNGASFFYVKFLDVIAILNYTLSLL
jgi:hypothetical protein